MLDQCFHVLGEKKLRKMLPDELKVPETHQSYKNVDLSLCRLTSTDYLNQKTDLRHLSWAHCQEMCLIILLRAVV